MGGTCFMLGEIQSCVGNVKTGGPLGWSVQGDAVCPKKRLLVGGYFTTLFQ
jgi:hypothetical protein